MAPRGHADEGFMLAGYTVERVTGGTLDEALLAKLRRSLASLPALIREEGRA